MDLVHFEVAFHLNANPEKSYAIRLLTIDDPAAVDDYLVQLYGAGNVVLHYAMRENGDSLQTCAAMFDKTLWRQL